jgi:hypothetical protein
MLDPEESPASAACDSTCNHEKSPARPAADKRVAAKEHRHVVQGTPAPHAGTPAPHDTNTGTTCTPPPNYQPRPPIDQREDQLRNVSTEGQALDLDDLKAQLIQFDELQARRRGA